MKETYRPLNQYERDRLKEQLGMTASGDIDNRKRTPREIYLAFQTLQPRCCQKHLLEWLIRNAKQLGLGSDVEKIELELKGKVYCNTSAWARLKGLFVG